MPKPQAVTKTIALTSALLSPEIRVESAAEIAAQSVAGDPVRHAGLGLDGVLKFLSASSRKSAPPWWSEAFFDSLSIRASEDCAWQL